MRLQRASEETRYRLGSLPKTDRLSCGLLSGSFVVYFVDFAGGCEMGGFVVYLFPQTRVGFGIGYLCSDDTDFQARQTRAKLFRYGYEWFHAFRSFG